MRYLALGVGVFAAALMAFGQGRGPYWSLGGFGNVLYPGTGHAPNAVSPGAPARPAPPLGGRNVLVNPIQTHHPQHGRTVIVPYPVFYGGYGYPAYDTPPAYDDPNAANYNNAPPPVVINQNFIPPTASPMVRDYVPDQPAPPSSGMRMYEAPTPGAGAPQPQRPVNDDQPTIYLIVFKDHSIIQALGYWMENGALHYVSLEHTINQVSLDLVDRDGSMRLNGERGIEFKLPAPR